MVIVLTSVLYACDCGFEFCFNCVVGCTFECLSLVVLRIRLWLSFVSVPPSSGFPRRLRAYNWPFLYRFDAGLRSCCASMH
jgi:hypothetical protein